MSLISSKTILLQDFGSTSILLCPRCGGEYLHHAGVTLFDRVEDRETVVKTLVADGKSSMEVTNGAGNPSSRRDGLTIQFWCEACKGIEDNVLEMTIAQHKGLTEIGWRYSPKAPDKEI